MSDLRQAAQKVVEAWDTHENGTMDHPLSGVMEVLRAALDAQEEHDTDCHAQGVCQRSGYSIGGPKPLTEDEIERLIQTYSGYCRDDFASVARAIERAHGIKGGNDE
jgi:hypothetical protein